MQIYDEILSIAMRWQHLGVEKTEDGCVFIGHQPEHGTHAYLHRFLPLLTDGEVEYLNDNLHVELNNDLKVFYRQANGVSLFSRLLSVHGYRKVLRNTDWDLMLRQPYDLLLENEDDYISQEKKLVKIDKYEDETGVYVSPDGPVFRFDVEGNLLTKWDSFNIWLISETKRFATLFDKNGQLLVDYNLTPPQTIM